MYEGVIWGIMSLFSRLGSPLVKRARGVFFFDLL